MLRIAVIGVAGRTGRLVLSHGLGRGLQVAGLAREPRLLPAPPPGARLVWGEATDPVAIDDVIRGAEGVISVLGTPSAVDDTSFTAATAALIARMERNGPQRLVITGNTSVLHDRDVTAKYAFIAAGHRRNLARLRASSLEWTMLAAAFLDDGAGSDRYDAVLDAEPPGSRISRAAYADAALDAMGQPDWIEHVVGVSS